MLMNWGALDVKGQTYAQRLGWDAADVVLILHIDDAGMSHSSNMGVVEATEKGVANSFSIMMPCSWVPEMARYIREHPGLDSGLHLTLTSEWKLYRWGPLAGKRQVPGLVDSEGCLWPSVEQVAKSATPDEVERELRAQIERAELLGIPITHLDSHMGTLFARPDYFERYAKLGIEKRIPIMIVAPNAPHLAPQERQTAALLAEWAEKVWKAGLPVLDDLHTEFTSYKGDKSERLIGLLRELKPGVTQILFHASRPTEEFPLITGSSAARRADLEALLDPRVKREIQERGIILTTWKELQQRREKVSKP